MTEIIGPLPLMTPVAFARCDEHGQIYETGRMSAYAIGRMRADGGLVFASDGEPGVHYIDLATGETRPKTGNPTSLDGLTLSNVPTGSTINVEDVLPAGVPERSQHVASGRVDLEFDFPGTYRIEVVSVKHLTAVFEVTV